jgi:hypothetical protein
VEAVSRCENLYFLATRPLKRLLDEADALPDGSPEKQSLQKEANSYKILAEAKRWLSGDLTTAVK